MRTDKEPKAPTEMNEDKWKKILSKFPTEEEIKEWLNKRPPQVEMSKEASTEKASEILWEKKCKRDYYLSFTDKDLFVKLVSLEAKIEVLEQFESQLGDPYGHVTAWIKLYKTEYDQLIKEHNL